MLKLRGHVPPHDVVVLNLAQGQIYLYFATITPITILRRFSIYRNLEGAPEFARRLTRGIQPCPV
jgi:hypothetical protein